MLRLNCRVVDDRTHGVRSGVGMPGPVSISSGDVGARFATLVPDEDFVPTEVETAGDIDGDGEIDLLIAGYRQAPVGPDGTYRAIEQGVILLFGDPAWSGLSEIPIGIASLMEDAAEPGDVRGTYISYSGALESTDPVQVSPLGDVNADGRPDLFIRREGEAEDTTAVILFGDTDRSVFAALPDLAPGPGGTAPALGGAGVILSLGDEVETLAAASLTGPDASIPGGPPRVIAAGDLNNDGVDDFAALLPGDTVSGAERAPVVRVVFGEAGLGGTLDLTAPFANPSDGFDIVLDGSVAGQPAPILLNAAGVGDFTGDGVDDIAVVTLDAVLEVNAGPLAGSPADVGALRVLEGRDIPGGDPAFPATVSPLNGPITTFNQELFGDQIAAAGDIDGDGDGDLLLSAPGSGGTQDGYLFFGRPDPQAGFTTSSALGGNTPGAADDTLLPLRSIAAGPTAAVTGSPTSALPYRFAGGGDFDGDGIADSFIADGGNGDPLLAGGTIFLGSTTAYIDQNQLRSIAAENLLDFALETPGDAAFFAADAAFAGDVLGDAGDELLVLAAGTVGLDGEVTDTGLVLFGLGAPAPSLDD